MLADRTISRLLSEGRIEIDPYDPSLLQPSSVDVRVDRFFRVFRNNRYPFIDVKQAQEELTELVEIGDEPFVLHPGEFVLGSTLERVKLPDDLVARLEGKALALDTEVPTAEGWKTMGEVEPGDLVFDEDGFPTVVLAATAPMRGRPCREVVFSDGTTVIADVEHLWRTTSKSDRRHGQRRGRVLATAAIERTLKVRDEYDHQVPLCGAIWYPERELPIDPYELGIWLGDGDSTTAGVTSFDDGVLPAVAGAGHAVAAQGTRPRALRGTGLLGRTHIPELYLRASIGQREALLQGLMDADGHVDSIGRCDLTTVERDLALQLHELVASLGLRPALTEKRAMLDGRDCGPKYEIQFTPDRPVFRLRRKAERQARTGRLHRFRSIVAVREAPSVPVRCIEVSSPNGMFLVTRSFVPTHNSSLGRLGLLIHSTAGFIDPGWDGHVTLELSNVANLPITIYRGMKIGQLSFMELTEPAASPYGSGGLGSKYQGQQGPTPSRYYRNFE